MFKCETCGAVYNLSPKPETAQFCDMPVDGGGTCRGKLEPVATVSGRVVREGLPARARGYQAGVDPAGGPDTTVKVLTSSAAAAKALAAILARVEMRAGGTYPGGAVEARLMFRSADDRAEFANAVAMCGGKVTA